MPKVIICKGLPASGKSSWAKKFCEENQSYVRVNRDDLRHMRGQYWLPKQEKMITAWERHAVTSALDMGFNVVLDATNFNPDHLRELRWCISDSYKHEVIYEDKFFDTPVDECIRRDRLRPNPVGEKVILGMYEKYLKQKVEYKESPELPRAIICDIDGTLAKMKDRGPFEWNKVGQDEVHEHIAEIVRLYYHTTDARIIIFSGRDGSCAEITADWLIGHGIPFHELHMRPAGNCEKDSIIKKRMFEQHVRGKYYVDFVLDDRDQVVRMWRDELGLNCLQVAYGNF